MLVRAALVLALVPALLVGASTAGGQPGRSDGVIVVKDKAGDVKAAKGLTKAERDALDVVSVKAFGQEGSGLFVTVTFKGNFEKLIGKGHLKTAIAGVVLVPQPGKGSKAAVFTQGPGKIGKTYRKTRSTKVGVARRGKQVTFFVVGPGASSVASIHVLTRATAPSAARKPAAAGQDLPVVIDDDALPNWLRIPMDVADMTLAAHFADLECDELNELAGDIDGLGSYLSDFADSFGSSAYLEAMLADLEDALSVVEQRLRQDCGPPVAIGLQMVVTNDGPNEVKVTGHFTGPMMSFDGLRIVFRGHSFAAYLAPRQLPLVMIRDDTIDFTGGRLGTGEDFQLNVRMSPAPGPGMGGTAYGHVVGGSSWVGPFAVPDPN